MSRPPRILGFDYRGVYRYFLTFCTFNRKKIFINSTAVALTLCQFRTTGHLECFDILAYCFMPDHTHFLVEGLTDQSDMRRYCKLAKQRAGSLYARQYGGKLWQEGYYDRVIRESDDILMFARYLLNNPVRAGLVSNPLDYLYIGSDRWSVHELIDAQQTVRRV